MVEARGVYKSYGTEEFVVHALEDVSLRIEKGSLVAVMGPSGCGKTTLLNALSGLDEIDRGEIFVAGEPLHDMNDARRTGYRARHMGFVFQGFNLMPVLSAVENVELPLLVSGASVAAARKRALEVLEQVWLADRAHHRPNQLSGGQQQRVAMARALAGEPAIVWADEPTGNLDSDTSREVLDLLLRLNRDNGQTFVVVTTTPASGSSWTDRADGGWPDRGSSSGPGRQPARAVTRFCREAATMRAGSGRLLEAPLCAVHRFHSRCRAGRRCCGLRFRGGVLGFTSVEGATYSALLLLVIVLARRTLGGLLARVLLFGNSASRRSRARRRGRLFGARFGLRGGGRERPILGAMILFDTPASQRTVRFRRRSVLGWCTAWFSGCPPSWVYTGEMRRARVEGFPGDEPLHVLGRFGHLTRPSLRFLGPFALGW